MSLQRKLPITRVRDALSKLFGNRCPVCDEEIDDLNADKAHIRDERWRRELKDLIRLCSNCNQTFDRSKHKSTPALSGKRTPTAIFFRGRELFAKGYFVPAYACYQLASFLFETREGNISRAVDSSIQSIACIRPVGLPDLLRNSIFRTVDLIERHPGKISPFWKGEFFGQLGLVLYDYERWSESAKCQAMANSFLLKVKESIYPEDLELKKAAADRRRVLVQRDAKTLRDLEGALTAFELHQDFRGLGTTLHVKAYLASESMGSVKAGWEPIQKALDIERKIANPWVAAELHLFQGRILLASGARSRALDEFRSAYETFIRYQIFPAPTIGYGHIDPGTEMRKLGISDAAEIGRRGRLPLSNRELQRVIHAVKNG